MALSVILAVGIAPILWLLQVSVVLLAVAIIALPWVSARMVHIAAYTVRGRLALGLFTGALVPLVIAVPAVLELIDVEADITDTARQAAFGVTLLLSIAAAVGGWWLARYLVDPLARLAAGVGRIADGVRPVRLTGDAPAEIEELAVAVETMAGKLDDQMKEIEEARDRHKTVAEKLQRALQVTIGSFPGVELAHVYRSASEVGEVGGDFYEVFHVAGDRIGILIGDVSGKGLDAAAQAVLIRTSVRAYTHYTHSPSEALARVNDLLLDAQAGFVTAFLGMLDPVSGELVCASAGHPPAILISGSRSSFLTGGSSLLGVFENAVFEETTLRLDPGDTLLLYTDGLTEARRGGVMLGEHELLAQVASRLALSPADLTKQLYREALAFSGGDLGDDLALLAIRLQPVAVTVAAR